MIAFTFYLEDGKIHKKDKLNRNYFIGIEENLKLIKRFYGSEWIMRLYYDIPMEDSSHLKYLCKLACENIELDLCDSKQNPRFGKYFRVCFSSRET